MWLETLFKQGPRKRLASAFLAVHLFLRHFFFPPFLPLCCRQSIFTKSGRMQFSCKPWHLSCTLLHRVQFTAVLAKLWKSVFREETSSCRPSARRVLAMYSSSAPAIPPLSPVNNALLCICSLCLIYNSHNVCRLESPVRQPYRGMGELTKPAAICCGSILLAPSKGLRGKCVLSKEPLPSVPPTDPLSIFTQHLHIVIHDINGCKHNGVAVFYHVNPAWACWKATFEVFSAASFLLPCDPFFVWRSTKQLLQTAFQDHRKSTRICCSRRMSCNGFPY